MGSCRVARPVIVLDWIATALMALAAFGVLLYPIVRLPAAVQRLPVIGSFVIRSVLIDSSAMETISTRRVK